MMDLTNKNKKTLAKLIGVHPSMITHLCKGRVNAAGVTAEKLAKFTNTNPMLWITGASGSRENAIKTWMSKTAHHLSADH